jgi:hypothetical protein
MSRIVLALVYFTVLSPLGFLLRLVHDPMARKWNKSSPTYRIDRRGSFRVNLRKAY